MKPFGKDPKLRTPRQDRRYPPPAKEPQEPEYDSREWAPACATEKDDCPGCGECVVDKHDCDGPGYCPLCWKE